MLRRSTRYSSVSRSARESRHWANAPPGNHTGYKQWRGTKSSAEEISDLYARLKQSYLTDFDMMLTGYAPNAKVVEAIGSIARDLKLKSSTKAGSFFWGMPSALNWKI